MDAAVAVGEGLGVAQGVDRERVLQRRARVAGRQVGMLHVGDHVIGVDVAAAGRSAARSTMPSAGQVLHPAGGVVRLTAYQHGIGPRRGAYTPCRVGRRPVLAAASVIHPGAMHRRIARVLHEMLWSGLGRFGEVS